MKKSLVSRREALKVILAAGGSITAAAFLPEKWMKPIIKTGVLPVHAQTSDQWQVQASASGSSDNNSGTLTVNNISVLVYVPLTGSDRIGGTPVPNAPVQVTYSHTGTGVISGTSPSLPKSYTTNSSGIVTIPSITFTYAAPGDKGSSEAISGQITVNFASGAGSDQVGSYTYLLIA